VIGISKLARIVDLLARRPVLQERLVEDITNALMTIEGCVGSGCIAVGRHYCMIMRGIRAPEASTITSSLKGSFLEEASCRAEFMSLTTTLTRNSNGRT
jgi:GTP cyclohydrolase I